MSFIKNQKRRKLQTEVPILKEVTSEKCNSIQLNTFTTYLSSLLGVIEIWDNTVTLFLMYRVIHITCLLRALFDELQNGLAITNSPTNDSNDNCTNWIWMSKKISLYSQFFWDTFAFSSKAKQLRNVLVRQNKISVLKSTYLCLEILATFSKK